MIKYNETETPLRGEGLHETWWQGRQWAVTSFGLECRDGTYSIEACRLCEDHKLVPSPYSWIKHMGTKGWVDIDDFDTAFYVPHRSLSPPPRRNGIA